ncbi:MAG: PIN domain-containing protein [Lentisphaeria bacterium]|nr:PIN domain-containing protein [Lentisphaeria bacterium]
MPAQAWCRSGSCPRRTHATRRRRSTPTRLNLDAVYFLWRPFLRDADDDMVLEAAVAGGCSHIVTHNTKDFRGVEEFGLAVLTPGQFLRLLRGAP